MVKSKQTLAQDMEQVIVPIFTHHSWHCGNQMLGWASPSMFYHSCPPLSPCSKIIMWNIWFVGKATKAAFVVAGPLQLIFILKIFTITCNAKGPSTQTMGAGVHQPFEPCPCARLWLSSALLLSLPLSRAEASLPLSNANLLPRWLLAGYLPSNIYLKLHTSTFQIWCMVSSSSFSDLLTAALGIAASNIWDMETLEEDRRDRMEITLMESFL